MARTIFPLCLLALLLLAAPGRAVAPAGEQRLLVLRLTWGPETAQLSDATIAASVERASAHMRAASYGRTWLTHDTTPWLHVWSEEPRTCDYGQLYAFTNEVAQRSGYDLGRYSHTVFVFPQIEACRWGGSYFGRVIWINRVLPWTTLAHELGHTYGLPEEGPAMSGGAPEDYANPYTVMGHGTEDYSAWEKWVFGWLERVSRAGRGGTYAIDALERPSAGAQALVVTTARAEYWFEYRPAHGVLAYVGANGLDSGFGGRFSGRDVLLGQVAGTFRVAGVFEARVAARNGDRATVAFRWLDRTRPSRPRARERGSTVDWDPAVDRGSGVDHYEVRAGTRVRLVPATELAGKTLVDAQTTVRRPGPGPVRVVAVDRAGNRSR